jgi:Ca2+-binding RTX toxin-like protein
MTVWDVTRYGATANGGADDTAAINRVINELARPGDTVLLPGGTYTVTGRGAASAGAISIAQSGITLAGAGQGKTIIKLDGAWSGDLTGIVRTASSVVVSDVHIRDLTIHGADRPGNIKGLYIGGGSNGVVHSSILVERVEIRDVSAYAFDPHGSSRDVVVRDSYAHDNGAQLIDGKRFAGFTVAGVQDALLVGNEALRNGSHGFNIVSGSQDTNLVGNEAYRNGDNGIAIQRGSVPVETGNVLLHGNDAAGNGSTSVRVGEFGSSGRIVGDVLVSDNAPRADVAIAQQAHDTLVSMRLLAQGSFDDAHLLRGTSTTNRLSGTAGTDLGIGMGKADSLKGLGGVDLLAGGSGNDWLWGGDAGDILVGGAGNDRLFGGERGDVMMGGSGNDGTLDGGNGNDLIHGGSGRDVLLGGANEDILIGGSGDDRLWGGPGSDLLRGGSGADTMGGGAGADYFDFARRIEANPQEVITDFTVGVGGDVLGIGALLTGYRTGQEAKFVTLRDVAAGTIVDIDPDGAGAAGRYALTLLRDVDATLAKLLAGDNLDFQDSGLFI